MLAAPAAAFLRQFIFCDILLMAGQFDVSDARHQRPVSVRVFQVWQKFFKFSWLW